MKLSQIFASEELSDGEKVTAIAGVVTKAREAYGNPEAKITVTGIHTTEGIKDLNLLSDESKVAVAASEVQVIIQRAVEVGKATEGAVLDREVERLIATNSILVNITDKIKSEYL